MNKSLGIAGIVALGLLAVSVLSANPHAVSAQDATQWATQDATQWATPSATPAAPAKPTTVSISLPNGTSVEAAYYAPTGSGKAPAAILLHELGATALVWKDFAAKLNSMGYAALAPQNFPSTPGGEDTIEVIAAWLRKQPGIDGSRVVMIGASIGANLAIRECAIDSACKVAVALSPGINYQGVTVQDAMSVMKNKDILLMGGQLDPLVKGITSIPAAAPIDANVLLRLYGICTSHGTALLSDDSFAPDAQDLIIHWLTLYN